MEIKDQSINQYNKSLSIHHPSFFLVYNFGSSVCLVSFSWIMQLFHTNILRNTTRIQFRCVFGLYIWGCTIKGSVPDVALRLPATADCWLLAMTTGPLCFAEQDINKPSACWVPALYPVDRLSSGCLLHQWKMLHEDSEHIMHAIICVFKNVSINSVYDHQYSNFSSASSESIVVFILIY
jgi:hypothetical protein